MRLLSVTLRNYRVHKELSVSFDPSRNLIGGPNESGKSTLAEAIHRALFLRAKTGGGIQKEMASSIHHGEPEVSLRFEACGVTWELEKRFAGTKGSTRLTGAGMTALKDEEADSKLSEILKTESGGRANASQLTSTWSHLWVWQGSSGEDPAGQPLTSGESRILADVGELSIGDGTRLRIRPGGGSSLSEARALAASAQGSFSDALARHTLRDLDQAGTVFEQRQALEQQIAQLETRWKALGGESLATELATAATAMNAAEAEVQRRKDALGNDTIAPFPTDLADARALLSSSQEKLSQAETAESSARRSTEQNRSRLETAVDALQRHRDQIASSRQSLRDLETSIKVLEETHGDATARQTALAQARDYEKLAGDHLAATRESLADLAPESLTADLERFQRAIAQQENRRREAEDRRTTARALLNLDGSSDPQADLSHALARCEAARELNASEQRRAKAIEKLHQLFSSSREAIDRSLVQPLADRISGYLQCLFGPGAEVRVNLSDTGIEGLDLIRAGDPAFGFSSLSGGAKEQVAAAVRLAMAEILATDHDGCLPILFDDAFAYTDPERIQSLQRMFDLAALRGLQVIILTCTPNDYSAFGAEELRMH